MEKYWRLIDMGDFNMVGHESGHLWKITYPRGSHYGAATRKQGYKLKYIWDDYSDDYGVFGIEPDNTDPTAGKLKYVVLCVILYKQQWQHYVWCCSISNLPLNIIYCYLLL